MLNIMVCTLGIVEGKLLSYMYNDDIMMIKIMNFLALKIRTYSTLTGCCFENVEQVFSYNYI